MRKPTRIALIAGTAGVIALAGTGAALAAGGGSAQQPAVTASPASDASAANISAAQAGQAAQRQLPGAAVTKTSLDSEHGRAIWEVDLTRNHHSYDVSVDAATGKIVSTHADSGGDDHSDNQRAASRAAAGNVAAAKVTAAQARQIAQRHVPGATVTETSLDREHGRAIWEVDLTRNHHGSEVSIDAATGTVVSTHADTGEHS